MPTDSTNIMEVRGAVARSLLVHWVLYLIV
jgi:hypothetical protein